MTYSDATSAGLLGTRQAWEDDSSPTWAPPIRAAIIGCGFIGVNAPDCHAHAYKVNPRCDLIAVCDVDFDKALAAAEKWDVPIAGDISAVGNELIDVISVCTPANTHFQVISDIVDIPDLKGIYLEKPIALTLEDADRIIDMCGERDIVLQVNHQRRFVDAKARFSRDMIDTGTHMFDLIRKTFGDIYNIEKSRIYCERGNVDIEYVPGEEHIFELDLTRSGEMMIVKGVENLVFLTGVGAIKHPADGIEAMKALDAALEFRRVQ